jgi:hypothetical protein
MAATSSQTQAQHHLNLLPGRASETYSFLYLVGSQPVVINGKTEPSAASTLIRLTPHDIYNSQPPSGPLGVAHDRPPSSGSRDTSAAQYMTLPTPQSDHYNTALQAEKVNQFSSVQFCFTSVVGHVQPLDGTSELRPCCGKVEAMPSGN